MAGKISKNKKQTKTAERGTARKQRAGTNPFCNIRDHFDPFDGALGSYKLLGTLRTGIILHARHACVPRFISQLFIKGQRRSQSVIAQLPLECFVVTSQ